jgi:hypothetical protein
MALPAQWRPAALLDTTRRVLTDETTVPQVMVGGLGPKWARYTFICTVLRDLLAGTVYETLLREDMGPSFRATVEPTRCVRYAVDRVDVFDSVDQPMAIDITVFIRVEHR